MPWDVGSSVDVAVVTECDVMLTVRAKRGDVRSIRRLSLDMMLFQRGVYEISGVNYSLLVLCWVYSYVS